MNMLVQQLRNTGFHVNETETEATIYYHGDFIMCLSRYSKRDGWKYNSSYTSHDTILRYATLRAYNWDVKRIYLR